MRSYKEILTSVLNAKDSSEEKTSDLTTSDQSLMSSEGLCPGESISGVFSLAQMDGKSSATIATMKKQNESESGALKYDAGKPPMELLSTIALVEIAKVMGKGKDKYGAQNWRSGLAWSRVIGAALRHISAFNAGEDLDPETGLSHLGHASCCLMFLLEYTKTHPELDDRWKIDL